jgi:DNA gyrase/topoisomerase IV subunit A
MVTTRKGQVVRMAVDGIRSTGRAAQGVTIMDLDAGDEVGAVALCPTGDDAPVDPAGN